MPIFTYQTKLTLHVYGVYTHGRLEGQTNPKSATTMHFYGTCFKHAIRKAKETIGGAFYQIVSTEEGDFGAFSAPSAEGKVIRDDLAKQAEADARYAAKVIARQAAREAGIVAQGEDISLPMINKDVDA
jgi:hypothetical protein